MTPAMHLHAIKAAWSHHPDADALLYVIEQAYALGHEFGIERAAEVVDQCNREGPYNAIGAAARIRALKVRGPSSPTTEISEDFAP